MAEPLHAVSTDLQIRIDDYLNDKLQTQADLDSLDSLLDDVKNRHNLLREQLKEAHAALEDARKASDDHRDLVRRKAEQLRQDEDNVEQRIQQLANSNESDEAIAKFEGSMERLHRLELAVKYVNALSEATALQEAAQRDLESNPARAVRSYSQLRLLSQALRNAQPAAEGAAPHLLNEIEQQVSRLYESFRKTLEARFEKTLGQLGWPRTEIQMFEQLLERVDLRCESTSRTSRAGPGRFLYGPQSPLGVSTSTPPSASHDSSIHAAVSVPLLRKEANKSFGQARVLLLARTGPSRISQSLHK